MASRAIQLISFLLIIQNVNAQFGEIASIVTGLLGSGAGGAAGLGSLAGTAGTAGLTGASGAVAGTNAISQIGQLYQLAQAALQLTGTGVGIVNQASESAWFPAALEQVSRNNREFQDRLLAGSGNGGKPDSRPGGLTAGGLGTGFPDLFGGMLKPPGRGVGTVTPVEAGKSEIGTEFGKELSSRETTDETTDLKPISTGEGAETSTVEIPQRTGLGSLFGSQRTLLPGEIGPEESTKNEDKNDETSEESPKITVQLPKTGRKPQLEFSIDSNEESSPLLPPPRAISPNDEETLVDVNGEKLSIPQMVPELQKLLVALHKSNLTADELLELTKQLEDNRNIGEPRENTTPEPRTSEKPAKTKSPIEQAAIDRNLLALRRALSSPTLTSNTIKKFSDKQSSPPIVLSLPKPTISSSTDVKLPAQKQLSEIVEIPTQTTTQSVILPKSSNKNQVKPGRQPVRESMVDGGVSTQRLRVDTEVNKRTRTATPTKLMTTTFSPPVTTTTYEQFYRQYYSQYYQQNQNPHAQIYNFYAQNPFGQLFYQQNPQQFGQTNVIQRPVAQPAQQQYYGQFSQPAQQQYYGQFQQPQQTNYYSTGQQQPRLYPLEHPLSAGSLLTLSQPKDYPVTGK